MSLWPVPADRAARLALAKSYPFWIPEHSYLYVDGKVWSLDGFDARDVTGRTPVLAVGSNQSPDQLRRKFGGFATSLVIPVTRAWLADFDVVFATHVTRYGAIPGNLWPVPGMRVRLSINWVTQDQLTHMHESEIAGENYVYARLPGIDLSIIDGPRLDSAFAYVSRHGAMNVDGKPAGLAALAAEGRPHRALDQAAALARLRDEMAPAADLDEFILQGVADKDVRRQRTEFLRRAALPFHWPKLEIAER
jgi:hypothetical protein